MALLVAFVVLMVAAGLLFWWNSSTTRYRIKYRANPEPEGQGRRLSEGGPNWREMLD